MLAVVRVLAPLTQTDLTKGLTQHNHNTIQSSCHLTLFAATKGAQPLNYWELDSMSMKAAAGTWSNCISHQQTDRCTKMSGVRNQYVQCFYKPTDREEQVKQ
jgi:hypothetical protein